MCSRGSESFLFTLLVPKNPETLEHDFWCPCIGDTRLFIPVVPDQDGIALVQHDSSHINTKPFHRTEALGNLFCDAEILHSPQSRDHRL